jgi:CheY-like chemotaxis protein
MTADALVVGDFKQAEREQILMAATRNGTAVVFCQTAPGALKRMRGGQQLPLCVLVSAEMNVRQLIEGIRDDAGLFAVPVLVALSRPSNDGYRNAYLSGADDCVVTSDAGGLTRRLANLSVHRPDSRPEATLGRVVVASSDETSRRRLGRILRQVGFEVVYASDLDEVARMSGEANAPAFAVATEAPRPGVSAPTEAGRRNVVRLGQIAVLLLAKEELEAPLRASDEVADLTSKLLFFADEEAKAQFKDRRASARELHSTICAFREAGSLQPTYGVSHNISREGMYVRTLDPPRPQSLIWLELHAPKSGTPIHLRARAMWQRLPGSGKGVLPPGFGLQLDAAQCPPGDLQAFIAGYARLSE